MFLKLAIKSVLNRRVSALLTVMAIAVGIFVLLGVEQLRTQARENFTNTVSGVDLIVGARTGSINLLLYSVFRVGAPTNNITWQSYQEIASQPDVEWAVPVSLGDSHKGYHVVGTTTDYFEYFSYASQHRLTFEQGGPFSATLDVVLGAEVAARLDYALGDELVLAHGVASTRFSQHDNALFRVVGVLDATGTPIDQTLFVDVQGIEAIHSGWRQGVKLPSARISPFTLAQSVREPETITAFLLGLKSRMSTFRVQRQINNYAKEPLLAILPGVTLAELWQTMALLEHALRLISGLVLLASVLGLSAMLLASIREREREIQLLRIIGAPPLFLFLLIELEALLIALLGIAMGVLGLWVCLLLLDDFLMDKLGLHLPVEVLSPEQLLALLLVILATVTAAAIPSFSAYRSANLAQAS